MKGLILSLCDYTGNWSRPYELADYEVIRIDLQNGGDIRTLKHIDRPVHGILAAPPCTHFCRAGMRLWASKGDDKLVEGLSLVDACLRCVAIYRPEWWCLENPVGRLKDYLGSPKWKFDPWQFGDPYTKRTWLWGHFTPPMPLFSPQSRCVVEPAFSAPGSIMRGKVRQSRFPSYRSPDRGKYKGAIRKRERSATPPGFSQAFFEANP